MTVSGTRLGNGANCKANFRHKCKRCMRRPTHEFTCCLLFKVNNSVRVHFINQNFVLFSLMGENDFFLKKKLLVLTQLGTLSIMNVGRGVGGVLQIVYTKIRPHFSHRCIHYIDEKHKIHFIL